MQKEIHINYISHQHLTHLTGKTIFAIINMIDLFFTSAFIHFQNMKKKESENSTKKFIIYNVLPGMKKHLTKLDTVYADVFQTMTLNERIDYCESLISSTEDFLTKSDQYLSESIKVKSNEIVVAARAELKDLTKLNKKSKL